jgi:hypothetical protein
MKRCVHFSSGQSGRGRDFICGKHEGKTTIKRLLAACVLASSLLLLVAAPASADPPTQIGPFEETFADMNPCTGLAQTGTLVVTFYVHAHDGRIVARADRTLSTSSGFFGTGTSSYVLNGEIEMFRFTDILSNDAGDRIRARSVFVADLSTGTVRVDSFDLTCLGS